MTGWYDISKSNDDKFMFVLKAGNAEIILTSELYTAKDSAESGIASVQNNCPMDGCYDRLSATNGKYYFNLKSVNHQVIGTSQMYETAQSRDKGIDSVKANGVSKAVKNNT